MPQLRKLVENFKELSGLPLDFTERGDLGRLGPAQGDALFKVLQEALANVVKHARAGAGRMCVDVLQVRSRAQIVAEALKHGLI